MAITPAEARARLERMVAASAVPTLDAAEVDDLMLMAARNDSVNVPPGEPLWVATYDLNAAAAEGWRWKAGRVAGEYTIGQDGSSLNRSDMHKHCLAMAAYYDQRVGQTIGDVVSTSRKRAYTIDLIPTGAGVGYGPAVTADVNGIIGRTIDSGPPTLVQSESEG